MQVQSMAVQNSVFVRGRSTRRFVIGRINRWSGSLSLYFSEDHATICKKPPPAILMT